MTDALAKPQGNLAPVVASAANPDTELLLHIRRIIQREFEIADLFLKYRGENKSVEWLRDMLAPQLVGLVSDKFDFAQIVDACQYLADEYNQLGEGYFLVATDTGKVTAVITEEDLYDPEKLQRYSGDEVQPLKRIKPNVEVALVTYQHEKAREQEIIRKLIERNPQTQLQKEEGDGRFKMATRGGRKTIVSELGSENPHNLLRRSGGTTGRFLQFVDLQTTAPEGDFDLVLEGGLSHRTKIQVQDPLAMNHGFNQLGTLKGTVPQGWIRDLCRSLVEEAYKLKRPRPVDLDDVTPQMLKDVALWLLDPDTLKAFRGVDSKIQGVPIEGLSPAGIVGKIGTLVIPEEFDVQATERFNRWEVVANIPYKFYASSQSLRLFPVLGIAKEAAVVF